MTVVEFMNYQDTPNRGTIEHLDVYVSASASNGDGSEGDPYSWTQMILALRQNTTIWLRGGTYTISGAFTINGESGRPIIFKPYPAEVAKLDFEDSFEITGNYTTIDGSGGIIEIYHSDWGTTTRYSDGQHDYFNLSIRGIESSIINCLIHDTGGNGNWSVAINNKFYGNLVWNIGQSGTGYLNYTQNGATGYKEISNNLMVRTYHSSYNIHLYGGTYLKRYRFNENVFIGGIILLGSSRSKVEDVNFNDCVCIGNTIQIGLLGTEEEVEHRDIHLERNKFSNCSITVKKGREYSIKNNSHYMGSSTAVIVIAEELDGVDIDNNDYHFYGSLATKFYYEGQAVHSLASWQGYGHDLNGSSEDATPDDFYQVISNEFDDDKGIIVIGNFSGSSSVTVDLSSLPLTIGRDYKLLNGQNPSESYAFTYTGAAITVPMTGWTVSEPLGLEDDSMPEVASIFPVHGAFYLLRDL